jgi:hypothetical protein
MHARVASLLGCTLTLVTASLGLTTPVGAAVAATPTGISPTAPSTLHCDADIGWSGRNVTLLPKSYGLVAESVAFPKHTFGRDARPRGPSRLIWLKQGIVVAPGAPFEIIVPPAWETRVNVSWGGSSSTTHLTVPGCPVDPGVEWLAFAGGYTVTRRACIPLIVRTTSGDSRTWIAAGKSCASHR